MQFLHVHIFDTNMKGKNGLNGYDVDLVFSYIWIFIFVDIFIVHFCCNYYSFIPCQSSERSEKKTRIAPHFK